MNKWKDLKTDLLKDPAVRAEYERLAPEFELAEKLLKARLQQKLTQAELAEKSGLSQVMIARLESGQSNPTWQTVSRVVRALDKRILLTAK